jgi:WD40 repeat protein
LEFPKLAIFDVRLIGAMAVVVITLVRLTNPEPMQRLAPSRVARGEHGAQVTALAFSPTGAHIATTNTAGRVTLQSPERGWQSKRNRVFPGYARGVAFSYDGKSLVAIGIEPRVSLWDLNSSSR